jgi:hypothetical protein
MRKPQPAKMALAPVSGARHAALWAGEKAKHGLLRKTNESAQIFASRASRRPAPPVLAGLDRHGARARRAFLMFHLQGAAAAKTKKPPEGGFSNSLAQSAGPWPGALRGAHHQKL